MENTVDIEAEKKKNIRIAIGIAASGILGGMFFYFLFFALMFLSPFSLFALIPFPDLQTSAAGLGEKVLIFSKTVDFSDASYTKEPEEIIVMREFDGESLSEPAEIEPFYSLHFSDNKVYLFDKERYRLYDGIMWKEVKNSYIGGSPKGWVGPKGILVLSTIHGKNVLNLIDGEMVKELPLPERDITLYSSQPVFFGNEIFMFWNNNGFLVYGKYDKGAWNALGSFEITGDYRILVRDNSLLLFWKVPHEGIIMMSLKGGLWSDPVALGIDSEELIVDYHPVEFRGDLAVVTQSVFSKHLYVINNGISESYSLGSTIDLPSVSKILLLLIIPFAVASLIILALSAVINKYKLRYWKLDGHTMKFASLFRRFLAQVVDTAVTSLPLLLFIPLFSKGIKEENPFFIFGLIFLGLIGYIVGVLLYYSLLEGIWGKTLGKRLCGIVVLKEDFTNCTVGRAFLRNLLRIADYMFYYLVGLVAIGATLKWQRLGDLAAGTVVVMDRKS
jgi:uncharacterized RDD family membrane protein YckC